MKGIVVPDMEEDFTADPVELFFDLAFVFGFSRLVYVLVHHHSWADVGRVALLFTLMWLAWSQFTWSANAVPGNQRGVRAVFLIATAVSVPMAGSIDTAFGSGARLFGLALATIVAMALALYVINVPAEGDFLRSIAQYAGISSVSLALIVVGGFVGGTTQIIIWLVATLVIFVAMALAGSGEFIIRAGHFAERHGLIIIIALGEVIVAVGVAVLGALSGEDGESGSVDGTTSLTLLAAGSFAALLWWAYFDRAQPALEHRAEVIEPAEKGRFARDVYTVSHLPIVGGIILAAAAVEEIALHPDQPLELPFGLMFVGGLALWLAGVCSAVGRAFGVLIKERVVAGAVIAALVLLGRDLDGVLLLIGVDCILIAMLAAEHLRIEGSRSRTVQSGATASTST